MPYKTVIRLFTFNEKDVIKNFTALDPGLPMSINWSNKRLPFITLPPYYPKTFTSVSDQS